MKSVTIEIGLGELLDRLSILELKIEKLTGDKQVVAKKEKVKLQHFLTASDYVLTPTMLIEHRKLLEVNEKLWEVEDRLRKLDLSVFEHLPISGVFRGDAHVMDWMHLARSVYFLNDERYRIKNYVDTTFGEGPREVKSYA